MTLPRVIPFDGLTIHPRTPDIQALLDILKEDYHIGDVSQDEVAHRLDDLLQSGDIKIEKNTANPHRGKFNAQSKKKWDQKSLNNPLSGKGKSYGKHVEDGWGQHVPVRSNATPDFDDPNWADDLWNSEGKW